MGAAAGVAAGAASRREGTGPSAPDESEFEFVYDDVRDRSPGSSAPTPHQAEGAAVSGEYPLNAANFEDEVPVPEPNYLDQKGWISLGLGLAIALVAYFIPLIHHTFATFMTLVHEMGHTIVNWLFGYPAFPAFDLMYGGGITINVGRNWAIVAAIYAGLGYLVYVYRRNALTVFFLGCLMLLHLVFSLTDAHRVLVLFMGHGTELIIAVLFLYRAMSGSAVVHSVERPLYAGIGLWIFLYDTTFAFKLFSSHMARMYYEDAKGGGHWMDFSRIAEDFLHVSLSGVALFFLVCCLAVIPLALLCFRYREYIQAFILQLVTRKPRKARESVS